LVSANRSSWIISAAKKRWVPSCPDGAQRRALLSLGLLEAEQIHQIPNSGTIRRPVRIRPVTGLGRLSRLRLVIGDTFQFASMNFNTETWSEYVCEMPPPVLYGDTTLG
jgi:hypothetical protein